MGQVFVSRFNQLMEERASARRQGDQEISQYNIDNGLSALPRLDEAPLVDPNAVNLPDPHPRALAKGLEFLSFGLDKLNRATQATREIALFANQKTSFEGFKKRFAGALKGDVPYMSRQEFTELMVGSETYHSMQQTPFIPGWFAAMSQPEQAMMGGKRRPKVSVADAFSHTLDFFVDPFALMSLTPVGAGSRLVRYGARALSLPFRPVTKGLDTLFGPRSNSPLSVVNFLRQPEDVLPKQVFQDIAAAQFRTNRVAHESMLSVQSAFKGVKWRRELDSVVGAWLHRLKPDKNGQLVAGTAKLSSEAKDVIGRVMPILNQRMDDLVKAGHIDPKSIKGQPFKDFYPRLIGKSSIPDDIWQSWDIATLGKVNLALRNGKELKGAINLDDISAIDSIRNFMHGSARKLNLEPALLKYAPKTGRVGEHALTSEMSRFQRRYLTDLINNFTGNGRGRKMIEFDLMVEDFFNRVAQSPMGNKILAMQRKLGNGMASQNTLPDFSTTNKIAGMMTHNIIRATLGGRLKSVFQNMTQVSNFAIAKGMPATFKGMLKFGNRDARTLRSEANLRQDFHALWDEDLWVSKLGAKYDQVIFSGFNLAEDIIRGTGFNVGVNEYLKKHGFKSIRQAIDAGHKDKLVNFAHFESINGAFIYGVLGRPPVFGNPILKPTTTLLSFPFKTAEFMRRTFKEDPTSMMRFIGMHGWMIQHANEHLGVAAEDFLGWGFTPMTKSFGGIPLPTSPQVSVLLDSMLALEAYAQGDHTRAQKHLKTLIDLDNKDEAGLPAGNLGVALSPGLPWMAIKDLAKLKEAWETGRQEIGGDGFAPIARKEAIANYLIGRSTTQKMRADLARRELRASRKIDFHLDQAAKKFVNAALGTSGDDLGEAVWEAAQGIEIEGQLFYPDPDMFNSRVNNLLEKKTIPHDIRVLGQSDFLQQIFIHAQLELFQRSVSGQ